MTDFLGFPINPGDYVVYGQLHGRSAGINVARIVEIETRDAKGAALEEPRLLVAAYQGKWYARDVVNEPGYNGGAYVIASVEEGDVYYSACKVEIADCSRRVSLSFDATDNGFDNSLRKIDILLTTLTAFRAAFLEERAAVIERAAESAAKLAAEDIEDVTPAEAA